MNKHLLQVEQIYENIELNIENRNRKLNINIYLYESGVPNIYKVIYN